MVLLWIKNGIKLQSSRITSIFQSIRRPITRRMSELPEVICLGNPLLDIQTQVDAAYLDKYSLKANDAILVDASSGDERMKIYEEIINRPNVHFVAGGAAQNTARGAAYVLGPKKVGYFGSVGKDTYADKLLAENEAAGVVSFYQVQKEIGTGKCAALITDHNRSLVTDLGAANYFTPDHLDAHWDKVEAAKIFYIGGFHLTVSPEAICKLGKHAQETGKPFVVNLSAPFIPQFFKSALEQVLPYTTHLIGNESEAASYAESFGLSCASHDLESIAKHIVGDNAQRIVMFTHGLEPTVIVSKQGTKYVPVKPVANDEIVDTNGAGDAFGGGFLAGLSQGFDFLKAADMGQWLASLSLKEIGPSYPKTKVQYNN